jgi:hypothetical protein
MVRRKNNVCDGKDVIPFLNKMLFEEACKLILIASTYLSPGRIERNNELSQGSVLNKLKTDFLEVKPRIVAPQ